MSDRFDTHDMKLLNLKHYLGYSFKIDFSLKNHLKYLKCGVELKLINYSKCVLKIFQTVNENRSITFRKSS